jgi:hypothetical protein
MKSKLLLIFLGGYIAFIVPVSAHHSFLAQYDMKTIITVQGIVSEVWYQNPHTRVYVTRTNEQDEEELWEMETPPRNVLVRRGWKHDDLKIGDEVVVTGRRARDGGTRLQVLTIKRPADGWEGFGFARDSVD